MCWVWVIRMLEHLKQEEDKQRDLLLYLEAESERNRKSQRDRILALLKKKDWVPTSVLRQMAYQYNARILELRRGLHDDKAYDIQSVRQDDKYGYVLQGWRE